jgi:hypothetical protein
MSEVAQTPVPEALVERARHRVWERLQASIADEAVARGWNGYATESAEDRIDGRSFAGGYGSGAWWQRSVALPLPVIAAASALFLVMAVGLVLNPGVLSNQYRSVAELGGTAPVSVQVQVNGNESDMLLKWLEEQNQVGNVTIQLPESAEFQLRGKPVLMRPESLQDGAEDELEIVPMEVSPE